MSKVVDRGRGRLMVGVAAVAALSAITAGCGSDSSSSGSDSGGSKAKTAKIAYVTYAFTDYEQAMIKGMKEKIGPGGKVTVLNANFDAQKQTTQCQDAVHSGRYNAMVLGAVDSATGIPCVTAARAAHIPVALIENPVGKDPDSYQPQLPGVVKTVVLPPSANGAAVAEETKLACADRNPCVVVAEIATPTDSTTNAAADAVAKAGPNIHLVQKIVTQYDPGVLAKAFPDALTAHPDMNVFVAVADSSLSGVYPTLEAAGKSKQIRLVANGGSVAGTEDVRRGRIFATVGNWPRQMGAVAAEGLVQSLNGQKIDQPAVNSLTLDTPLIVDRQNVSQFKPEWGAAG
jgi:ribose transport system substrate-binding protein